MAETPSDDPDESPPDEGKVLSPDELDIADSEYVEELEEGRYVVSPNKRTTPRQPEASGYVSESQEEADSGSTESPQHEGPKSERPAPSTQESDNSQTAPQQSELTQEVVHQWLREDFEQNSSRYAFDVTATFDGTVSQRRMASNDVVTIFESLMLWYAQEVDNNTPVEEILGILLMESNVPVRYPPKSLANLIKSADLGPDDTIADLLRAVREDDGVQL